MHTERHYAQIYPALRRVGINFSALKKITAGETPALWCRNEVN